ncbi:SDR family NAD(P)-dependent oxidoreductase [Halalkalibacter urbisdiaboli]|uniref:SDR family NAD(P)-dependent oxidoreductase n=1 Tax=Halalkalibacter urbisdiaboli TaxID=1960589 RepID=UPI000B44063F|nr:SDR family oxidoreductase [Halalkalibacter urbisdiaboli]
MIAKKIWITGASSGLGRQLAIDLAKRGDIPVVFARNEAKLKELYDEIIAFGGKAFYAKLDVSKFETIEPVLKQMLTKVGGVDVLINNAGFAVFQHLKEASFLEAKEMFDVNVLGLIKVTQLMLPSMLEKESGHIINIASQAGKFPTPKASVYAATKHAVLGFTNSLRMELKHSNIKVSSVNPGPIRTPFFTRADEGGSYAKNVEKWMLSPDYVSQQMIKLIDEPRRELNLPRWMDMGSRLYQLMPSVVEKIAGKKLHQK